MNLSNLIKGRDRFPLESGLAQQQKQLAEWKKRLRPEVYQLVHEEAVLQNQTLPSDAVGFDVWRGDNITVFVTGLELK